MGRPPSERLEFLKSRKAKIDAQIAQLDARDRADERKRETRRKIVAGAILLEAVQQDRASAKPSGIAKWWEAKLATLDRPQDRSLFASSVEPGHPAERSGA